MQFLSKIKKTKTSPFKCSIYKLTVSWITVFPKKIRSTIKLIFAIHLVLVAFLSSKDISPLKMAMKILKEC